MTENIDPEHVASIQSKYESDVKDFKRVGDIKYLDIPYWLANKIMITRQLYLDVSPAKAVLDIGTGPGHFAAVCSALGHAVVGTDIYVPMYDDICQLLNVDRRVAPTRLRTPLPAFDIRFDLVTIMFQVFHVKKYLPNGMRVHWAPDDWAYLLNDLVENHLRRPGEIFLYLNKNKTSLGGALDEPLMAWSQARGADTDDRLGWIWFKAIERSYSFGPMTPTLSM